MSKKTIIKIALWLLVFAWMAMIFSFSAEQADDSTYTSGNLIKVVCKLFNPSFDQMTESEQWKIIEQYQFFVRKGAHFSVYTVLGMLISIAVSQHTMKKLYRIGISFICGGLYSISDEIHQRYVPGRSGEIRDVLIDSSGVLLGCIIIYILNEIIKRYSKRKTNIDR